MEKAGWPQKRWACVVAALMGVQLLLIWGNSGQNQPLQARNPRPAVASLVFNVEADAASSAWLALSDPTLFSMASPNNFSGRAWLTDRPMAHPWKEWMETQGGEMLKPENLGQTTARTFGNRLGEFKAVVEKPEAELTATRVNGGPVLTQSVMRIEGELAALKLEKAGDLSGWTNGETLGPTTVELGVGTDGLPHSVRLVERCGLAAADQNAVNVAQGLRFAPRGVDISATPELVWGLVKFQWQTLMVVGTNGVSANH